MSDLLSIINGNAGVFQLGSFALLCFLSAEVRFVRRWIESIERRVGNLENRAQHWGKCNVEVD